MQLKMRTLATASSLLLGGFLVAGCNLNTGGPNSDSWPVFFHNNLRANVNLQLCNDSTCSSTFYSDEIMIGKTGAENVATNITNKWRIVGLDSSMTRCLTINFKKYERDPVIQLSHFGAC
jgi:hypothetical protein